MFFILRAGLVIGALSYLAINRDSPGPPGSLLASVVIPRPEAALPSLAAAWDTLPAATRERLMRDGAAEIGRRVAGALVTSRDTLAEADRQPVWRGTDNR
ncbi:hypothetical protein G3T14_06800 [Methylobacterium sp. BTF04]|uniref:hypothetical protein n=1 Tax=Methylobacterium sp. BTF04 TaxID=2708300 RepID=UPI0013D5EB46|nr:hypothetical protein [Methylobacterium sp. BTF04]NEU11838.1 hypothetical protein [Methylobacterium sp. BTF04]